MIGEAELQSDIKKIKGTRKERREEMINKISLKFINFCKERNKTQFPREHLSFLVDCLEVKERQKREVVLKILNLLKEKHLIREDVKITPIYTFRNKPLISFDYGSYNLMMRRNGYKRVLSKWSNTKGYPSKKRIATIEIGDKLPNELDYNEIETKSWKGRDYQGVYTNSNFSIVRDFCFYSEKKVYSVL